MRKVRRPANPSAAIPKPVPNGVAVLSPAHRASWARAITEHDVKCDKFELPNGQGTAIICSRGRRQKCKDPGCDRNAVALCDWPLGGPNYGKTCDRPMCGTHRHSQGEDKDFCPGHERAKNTPHIWCPRCHMPSFNPNDIEKKFCGHCNAFHDQLDQLPPYEFPKKGRRKK